MGMSEGGARPHRGRRSEMDVADGSSLREPTTACGFQGAFVRLHKWLVQWLAQVIDLAAESVREGESFTELELALPA